MQGWGPSLLGAGAIVVGAWTTVPMVPVPMTLQTLAVLLAGLLLGPQRGAGAAFAYLLLVLLGLPVLADGARAPGTAFLELKSAGYVVGFIPGAWVAGRLARHRVRLSAWIGAGVAGHLVVLACGVPVLAAWIGWSPALRYGLLPFLPGAALKSVLAGGLAWPLRRAVRG